MMYFFFAGLFFVSFQVTCHGVSERLIQVPQLPVNINDPEETKQVEKREECTDGFRINDCILSNERGDCDPNCCGSCDVCTEDIHSKEACQEAAEAGYCDPSFDYYDYVKALCCFTCEKYVCTEDIHSKEACQEASEGGYCDPSFYYYNYMQVFCCDTCKEYDKSLTRVKAKK